MIERHQGRARPSRRAIGGAEIKDGVNAGFGGEPCGVADLDGPPTRRLMQHALTVKADEGEDTPL
jgi:hypothetical protein